MGLRAFSAMMLVKLTKTSDTWMVFSRTQEFTFQLNTYFILSKNKISCKNIHDIPSVV